MTVRTVMQARAIVGALTLFCGGPLRPAVAAGPEAAVTTCTGHLLVISRAQDAYRRDHGELPPHLPELYPRYLADKGVLHCPNDASPGRLQGERDRGSEAAQQLFVPDDHGPAPVRHLVAGTWSQWREGELSPRPDAAARQLWGPCAGGQLLPPRDRQPARSRIVLIPNDSLSFSAMVAPKRACPCLIGSGTGGDRSVAPVPVLTPGFDTPAEIHKPSL